MENIFSIKNQRITDLSIHFPNEANGKIKLEAKCTAELKKSKNKDDHSILLAMKIIISSANDEVNIELNSETVFELNKEIDNMNEFMEKELIPKISNQLFIDLDDILLKMGYQKMNFAGAK